MKSAKRGRGRRVDNRADHTENRLEEPVESDQDQGHDIVASGPHGDDADEEDGLSFDGNSVAGSVLDPTEPSPFNQPSSVGKKDVAALIQGRLESGPGLDLLKT